MTGLLSVVEVSGVHCHDQDHVHFFTRNHFDCHLYWLAKCKIEVKKDL